MGIQLVLLHSRKLFCAHSVKKPQSENILEKKKVCNLSFVCLAQANQPVYAAQTMNTFSKVEKNIFVCHWVNDALTYDHVLFSVFIVSYLFARLKTRLI